MKRMWAFGLCGALVAANALAQDFGLDLTDDADTGGPKIAVTVEGAVEGAELYVDGKRVGTLPLKPQSAKRGEHTVTVKRPGYEDFTQGVTVPKSGTVSVNARLTATGEVIRLTSDPDGADVVVDGKGQGKTPATLVLSPGKHDLRVVHDGYLDWTYVAFTRAGRDTDLSAELKVVGADRPTATNLEPEQVDPDLLAARKGTSGPRAWYQRWYVWAGAAVVVAGVATAVAVSSHPSPSPASVCGGACDIVLNPP